MALRQDAGNQSAIGEDITFEPDRVRTVITATTAVAVTSRCGRTNEPELAAAGGYSSSSPRSADGGRRESSSSSNDDAGGINERDDDDDDDDGDRIGSAGGGARQKRRLRRRRRRTQPVCVLWNHVPDEITLAEGVQSTAALFVMSVDARLSVAEREIMSGKTCGGVVCRIAQNVGSVRRSDESKYTHCNVWMSLECV